MARLLNYNIVIFSTLVSRRDCQISVNIELSQTEETKILNFLIHIFF